MEKPDFEKEIGSLLDNLADDVISGLEPKLEPILEPEPSPEPGPKLELEPSIDLEPSLKLAPEPIPKPALVLVPESESEPEDELTQLRNQNKLLLERLEAMPMAPVADYAKPAEPTVTVEPEKAVIENIRFIEEGADVDELLGSAEKLNTLLNRVYSMGVEKAVTSGREATIRSIPQIVMSSVQNQLFFREGIKDFFDANPNLKVARRTVGAVMNEVAAEHPDWKFGEVLNEAGNRTYKALGLKKETTLKEVKLRNPALPDGTSSGRKKEKDSATGLQKEINEIILD